jgi:hypothetical protein
MASAIRLPVLTIVALAGLGLAAPAQAQQATMSFFVTSVGEERARTSVGLLAPMRTVRPWPRQQGRLKPTGMPI